MRTTITLDDELVADAIEFTGIDDKSLLIRMALKSMLAHEAARRLAALGGSQPDMKQIPRRRPKAA